MIVSEAHDGNIEIYSSIGGGPLEARVIEDAKNILTTGKAESKEYHLNPSDALGLSMTCGGRIRIFFETIFPENHLFVFGAGVVGCSVVEKAKGLGFAITVLDDRPERLELLKGKANTLLVDWYSLKELPNLEDSYILILTRCHRTDKRVLAEVINKNAAYIGMIGSRRKVAQIRKDLEKSCGIKSQDFENIHAPVGIDIGSESPEEIAISIWAEILKVRSNLKLSGTILNKAFNNLNDQDEGVSHGIL